jgi:predicted small secreted protein
MNTKKLFAALAVVALAAGVTACNTSTGKSSDVERISVTSEKVTDIETSFPGQLLVSDAIIIWSEPFNSKGNYAHILDKASGNELGSMLKTGQGPDEMISPNLSMMNDNKVMAYGGDGKQFIISVDSVLQGKEYIVERLSNQRLMSTQIIPVSDMENVHFDLNEAAPFVAVNNRTSEVTAFGHYPFDEEIKDKSPFQGILKYNNARKKLVYSTFLFPYIAVYSNNNGNYSIHEERLAEVDYRVVDGLLRYNAERRGASELAISKDYIITLERDREFDSTDDRQIGRDITKMPQTVFIYDYDLNLLSIVNLGMPVGRLAANQDDNVLYFIGANPDFAIEKVNLDQLH